MAQPPLNNSVSFERVHYSDSYVHARSTAVALAVVTVVLLALSCLLWGVGTSPEVMFTGMGFVPYLAGTFISAIAVGVLAGSVLYTAKMIYLRRAEIVALFLPSSQGSVRGNCCMPQNSE